jgi:Zn finger protein HypA/HybF involved in hydrogenase expression
MERDQLHCIAKLMFEAIPVSCWEEKSAEERETAVQRIVSELANVLMEEFIFPGRIKRIEQKVQIGQIRCEQCQSPYQQHKAGQPIQLKTIFGDKIHFSRHQYYCPGCDQYQMVADRALGLIGHQMTPRLALVTALCGASWPYEVAGAFLSFLLGVSLSTKTVQNVTCDPQLSPQLLAADPLDNPPGVVAMDGVLIRSREKDQWLEMKVGSFFSQVVEVSKHRKEVLDASFVAGAMQRWEDFAEPVTAEAHRRGLQGTEAVEFVSHGAEGIWSLQQLVFPYAQPRLDLYHTRCKITERTEQAYEGNGAKAQHQEKLQACLGRGLVEEAVAYVQKHMPCHESQKEAAHRLIRYLQRHQSRIPDYQQVKEQGGTVSSGLMEKANDLIVVRRLKQDTMHWSREKADPVIQQRTAFINQHSRARTGPYDVAFCRSWLQ